MQTGLLKMQLSYSENCSRTILNTMRENKPWRVLKFKQTYSRRLWLVLRQKQNNWHFNLCSRSSSLKANVVSATVDT